MKETFNAKTEDVKPTKSIGIPMPLVDGPEKVSGKANYTADKIEQGRWFNEFYAPRQHTPSC